MKHVTTHQRVWNHSCFVNSDAAFQQEDVAKFPQSPNGFYKNVLNGGFVAWHYFVTDYGHGSERPNFDSPADS